MTSVPHDPQLSAALQTQALRLWQRLCPDTLAQLGDNAHLQIWRLLALSEFVGNQLARDPQWLTMLWGEGQLQATLRHPDYATQLAAELALCPSEADGAKTLRRFRNRELCRIACRDLLNLADLNESLTHLSALAEAVVIAARDFVINLQAVAWGRASNSDGIEQPLLILGMGKLGGAELNFSSDIDLIFCYPEHGETQGGRRQWDNQQYFIRIGQKLINLLAKTDVDGFCYRVDMRLRPFGEAGPLVVSLAALEDYYQEQGREWERFAMVKARVLGNDSAAAEVNAMLRPFVYRRYLDYSAIDALRRMKGLIEAQIRRQAIRDNIKLGAGGIREVEFVVQSHQLIRGGREPGLRMQPLRPALEELERLGVLGAGYKQRLRQGYDLLRSVENRLQALNDQQTQTLPNNPDDLLRLALAMGDENADQLLVKIDQAMADIHQVFRITIGDSDDDEQELGALPSLWLDQNNKLDGEAILTEQQIEPELWPKLQRSRDDFKQRRLGPRGRETLDKLMPHMWQELAKRGHAEAVWLRLESVLLTILTRTTYLELLLEKAGARTQLANLCASSPWIAEQLARYPVLLDELIDPVALYQPLPAQGYAAELREFMLRISDDDLELQMEALRQFKQAQQLRIAAADVTGVLPVMKVSDHLSWLAEAIIEKVVEMAWYQISRRFGVPHNLDDGNRGFGVVAYGKLGGFELGYGSDLDLVFLHQADVGDTDGDKAVDASHFYIKLAQRILHLFSTRTSSGVLYEVDMRLRPSGQSGLLVSQIGRFEEYQQREAWTWEHQALTRARFVFGDDSLAQRFARLRHGILMERRDRQALQLEVVKMRQKMRDHLNKSNKEWFDLKQGCGGITDIEFMTQYLVLAHSAEASGLVRFSDNVRILEAALKAELISPEQAALLTSTYIELRDDNHHRVLAGDKGIVPLAEKPKACEQVALLWQQMFEH
ncbi:bifunctional [glutamate--ammonia ligase]-adenylyl-L-tyrosine phosphorylase/[glutamate--ammonia-ligase] adenylyltransferase [Ferrimonas lipolytica]|uniref:Bifunctional glutamine synthetase adenylyltransferase/adenylyl-removing enzyme n=1 Tax=Ferrimonas lipolytica TaxID=2724191 RepID=A0A6H1UFC2_9GAMM|nr:bifunctional [glutamate--ammonia ligase]-adenylyl-L-tyrosine phosphorylase/[glutamate--ammonia-ligase] adenylyltransferase [Ferrimonas lipolytica]QIZ77744.1 bifunctional [glutamate--ammonia ligase]-adenylyl-L-tyrosine phosphorylase/[glutamate--ammonia-ligase] adenylyltransferase [Ferrimonas lipolytica]